MYPFARRPRLGTALLAMLAMVVVCLPGVAHAREECLADAVGDLSDLVTGSQTARNPRADIQAMCASHSPGRVDLSVRLGQATDIATYPAWEAGRSALVLQVGVNPATGEDRQVDYEVRIGRSLGVAAYSVVRLGEQEELTCGGALQEASLPTDADPTIRISLDTAACTPGENGRAPAVLRAGAFIIFTELDANPTLDEVPADDERFGAPLGTEPRPEGIAFEGVRRLGGATRLETAVAVSRETFAVGAAGAVVLATGEPPAADGGRATSSPDALAAAPLAVHVGGPLLLLGAPSPSSQMPDVVLQEIRRVLQPGGTVYLVGGEAVIHPAVDDALEAEGFGVQRLAGSTREVTSLAVGLEISDAPTRIVLADGSSFQHALLGASYAAATNRLAAGPDGGEAGRAVLLLTTRDSGGPALHPVYVRYLRTERAGRELVVVGAAAAEAARRGGLPVEAVNTLVAPEDDAFATAAVVAGRYDGTAGVNPRPQEEPDGPQPLPGISPLPLPAAAVVVSGLAFPDAISGAALAGHELGPLLFTWPDSLPEQARALLRSLSPRLQVGYVVGGPVAVKDTVSSQLSECGVTAAGPVTPECRPT